MYCVTVGRVGSSMPRVRNISLKVFGIKVYKLQKRQKDGLYTWRLVDSFGTRTGTHLSERLLKEAKDFAESKGWPFMWVTHGDVHRVNAIEALAIQAEENADAR